MTEKPFVHKEAYANVKSNFIFQEEAAKIILKVLNKKGNYKETDPLLPVNYYAWSKLGGEASVQLYKNSLIVRVCMTEKPFVHKKAFANVKTSFAYHDEVARILFKILNQKGILNVGGKTKIIYQFAKKDNKFVKKSFLKKNSNLGMPFDSSINISKLKKLIRL